MARRLLLVFVVTVLAAASLIGGTTGSVSAGAPGQWTRITGFDQEANWEVAHIKSIEDYNSDGQLDLVEHVAWIRHNAVNSAHFDLVETAIYPDGTVGPTRDVAIDWLGFSQPDIVESYESGHGLRIFFGGIRSGAGDPQDNLNSAYAPDGGAWVLTPGTIATDDSAYAGDIGAERFHDGTSQQDTFFQTWANTGGVFVHRGLDPSTPNFNYQIALGGCCGYSPDLQDDLYDNRLWLTWWSLAPEHVGLWAQEVDAATGAPLGDAILLPNSATNYAGTPSSLYEQGRIPIGLSGDSGSGLDPYVAYTTGYPVGTKVRVWRIGSTITNQVIATNKYGFHEPALAVFPSAGLWVLWEKENSVFGDRPIIQARHANPFDPTKWGATVQILGPNNATDLWELDADAQNVPAGNKLDILAQFETPAGLAYYHTQIYPGLTVTAKPATIDKDNMTNVTFAVTDAGRPVPGAKVSVAGKQGTTDAQGKVTIKLGTFAKKQTLIATASKAKYTDGKTTIAVTK